MSDQKNYENDISLPDRPELRQQRRWVTAGVATLDETSDRFALLMQRYNVHYSWAVAIATFLTMLATAGVFGSALVAVALLMRDHPDEVGLAPYGGTERVTAPPRQLGMRQLLLSPLVALREASKTATFWALFFTFYVRGLSTNGLIQTHWIAMCGDFGVVPVSAAGMLAIVGCFDFVGTILSGWLSDRYDNRWLLFVFYGLRGVSLIYLPFSGFTLSSLSIFAVFYGLDWVATVPPTVKLVAERFGPEKASLIFGWIFAAHQLGAATAAFGAGATRTEFATYLPALYIAGAFCIAASLVVISLPKISKPGKPHVVPATARTNPVE